MNANFLSFKGTKIEKETNQASLDSKLEGDDMQVYDAIVAHFSKVLEISVSTRLKHAIKQMEMQTFQADQMICEYGSEADCLYILKQGCIIVTNIGDTTNNR